MDCIDLLYTYYVILLSILRFVNIFLVSSSVQLLFPVLFFNSYLVSGCIRNRLLLLRAFVVLFKVAAELAK